MDAFETHMPPTGDTRARRYEKIPEMEIDDARFDQPPFDPSRSRRRYVICSTQRSGSFLLCRQLINAGLGVPQEYFNKLHIERLSKRWSIPPKGTPRYFNTLDEKRTSPNGVWGLKLQWPQFTRVRADLEGALWGDARTIFLYRDDLDAQAVSLHISFITGIWGFDMTRTTEPSRTDTLGDLGHVLRCRGVIESENDSWQRFFSAHSIEPLVIRYEDFVRDQPGFVRRIADWLGVTPNAYWLPPAEPREGGLSPDIESVRASLLERLRR